MKKIIIFFLAILLTPVSGITQSKKKEASADLKSWPVGSSPREIGDRVAARFVATPHPNFGRPEPPKTITYPEVCAWYGALSFARQTKNKTLLDQLVKRFDPLLSTENQLVPYPDHVDYTVFGAIPLEIYMQTGDRKYYYMGMWFAEKQWGTPEGGRVREEHIKYYQQGLTWQTRLWIDDMFMITAVQAQAFRASGKRYFIDRTAREMVVYLDSLQRDNGLFYHAPDVPYFWGRGDGWMAAGSAELLRILPEDNPDRPRIMEGYKKMMASLLKYQSETGMWRQLIDDAGSWPETSCTGMFTYAMIIGVQNGWLDKEIYGRAVRKAWLALVTYLDANGDISEVCQGTNKKNDRQYYLDRQRIKGDMHGQAPVLWCAAALSGEME